MRNPGVLIFDHPEALTTFAAALIHQLAMEAVAARGRCIFALSGGSTPRPVYRLLTGDPFRTTFPWAQTHFLLGDERLVRPTDPESNLFQASQLMLEPAGVPQEHIYPVNSALPPEEAAEDYADRLRDLAEPGRPWPHLDIALNGMGSDGHTASLFPAEEGPRYTRPVIAISAEYGNRPAQRVTLTPLILNDTRNLVYLVTGSDKAAAVAAALEGPHDPARQPTQRIKPDSGRVFWLLDKAAAGKLKNHSQPVA